MPVENINPNFAVYIMNGGIRETFYWFLMDTALVQFERSWAAITVRSLLVSAQIWLSSSDLQQ